MTKHTPTPWKLDGTRIVASEPNKSLKSLDGQPLAVQIGEINNYHDATFIIRTVNAHEELLAASKEALMNLRLSKESEKLSDTGGVAINIQALEQAIAKAEGK